MTRTSDRRYLANRAKLKRQPNLTCVVCGQPIDLTLTTWTNPDTGKTAPHPMSFSADHTTPVALGGNNRGPLQPTHRCCNRLKGTKDLEEVRHNPHSRQHY